MAAATKLGGATPRETRDGDRHDAACQIDDFALRLIRRKAKQICRRRGFSLSDRPDLEQELALIVLRRLIDFDPARAHYNAFVTTVVERYTATILEHRAAEKRSPCRCGGSLDEMVNDADGCSVPLSATMCESSQFRHTGQVRRSQVDACDLRHDVSAVLQQMPPVMREVCELLMSDTKAAAARKLGMSQGAIYEILQRVLVRFEKAGLREYLQ
jgi:RNA polymerase sigma-70 factor (ECF subfamily)